jgi:hypothetical protein
MRGASFNIFDGIEDMVDVSLGEGTMLMIDGETVAMGGMGEEMGMGEDTVMAVARPRPVTEEEKEVALEN